MAKQREKSNRLKDIGGSAIKPVIRRTPDGVFRFDPQTGQMKKLLLGEFKKRKKAKHEPLSPRGKTETGGGVRIPVRSQQSIAKAMDRRRRKK